MRTDRQTHRGMDGRTDMAKLIVTFRNFASTPKIGYLTACHAWTQFTFMRRVETLCGCPSTSILLTETWQTRCCFVARRSFVGAEKNYTGAYNLSEEFAKPYFHKYWNEIHGVITIWKRNVCSLIVTLNAFDERPTCDTADVQAILQFPPNPLKHVLCDVPNCGVDVLSAILVVSLVVVGRKHCPWRNPTGRNHTLSRSGDRGGQVQKVLPVAAAWPTAISLQHWFTLFPLDGSSGYRTIPNITFTVCNRQEFHDLATLPTQVMV